MTSRRTFIKQASLLSGGLFLIDVPLINLYPKRKPTVIIIGAGFAGLSAAYELYKRGIGFTILESSNRVGGRVRSHVMDKNENLIVELGAEWIGHSHTLIQSLCDEMKLPTQDNQFDTHLIYKGQYSKSNTWDYSESWITKFEQLKSDFRHLSCKEQRELDNMDWWRYLVNNGCEGRDLDIRELADSTDFGETIRSVSAYAALAEYAESSEKNEMDCKIEGGNERLAHSLADKVDRNNIKLNHKVERIEQGKNVKVYCSNGQSFEADKLICTAPTFAVKKIKWEPELPEEVQDAMNQLQYARINKNPILFKERFWKEERFDLLTDLPIHYLYNATKNQSSKKGVLIGYTIGDKAAIMPNQSDEWRADMMAQSLSPYFGNIKSLIEDQTNFYWGNHESTMGAYALYGKGQWFGIQPILRKSFKHTHFAGEHLADWQGFMEGALQTGLDAVEEMLK